ncbi:MAG: cysteine desulfurase [Planctomycetes bacterium]|nr:cysteine desulfurase [Planctomycetota bacterium]
MNATIDLDHNATTRLHPEVWDAMERTLADAGANPESQHAPGRRARRALEECRERIAEILGCRIGPNGDRVLFTSGGTESNNMALRGLAIRDRRLVVSDIEHPSVAEVARAMALEGWKTGVLPVDADGIVDVDSAMAGSDGPTGLISVMLGNHETGVLQPVARIAEIADRHGALVHTDAVQAVGKGRVDFQSLGVAAMTISAHKFHGPVGIGALIVRRDAPIRPSHYGGSQQGGLRPGTQPVWLAVGMRRALELWHGERDERAARMRRLRDRLEEALDRELPPIVVVGRNAPRLPHVSNIAFPGCDRQALMMALDARGVACSTGSACASGSSEPSPVLRAMRVPPEVLGGALRFSLGAFTTEPEIDEAARRIAEAVRAIRARGVSP